MKDPKLYEKYNGTNPVEYGFGDEWVATAMYMDDYPRFYTEDEAVLYWYHRIYKEEQHAKSSSA